MIALTPLNDPRNQTTEIDYLREYIHNTFPGKKIGVFENHWWESETDCPKKYFGDILETIGIQISDWPFYVMSQHVFIEMDEKMAFTICNAVNNHDKWGPNFFWFNGTTRDNDWVLWSRD